MNDEKAMAPDGLDEVPPHMLALMRLRLVRCESESSEKQFELLKEIVELGKNAVPLMPILVEKYRTDKLLIPSLWSVDLYLNTQYAPLLHALIEKNELPKSESPLGISQLCQLFDSGLPFMEADILGYLWKFQSAEPGCMEAVKSLGKYGGPEALDMLEAIRFKLSGELPEKKAKWSLRDERDGEEVFLKFVEHLEYGAHESFLEEVRKAIACIKERIRGQDQKTFEGDPTH